MSKKHHAELQKNLFDKEKQDNFSSIHGIDFDVTESERRNENITVN